MGVVMLDACHASGPLAEITQASHSVTVTVTRVTFSLSDLCLFGASG